MWLVNAREPLVFKMSAWNESDVREGRWRSPWGLLMMDYFSSRLILDHVSPLSGSEKRAWADLGTGAAVGGGEPRLWSSSQTPLDPAWTQTRVTARSFTFLLGVVVVVGGARAWFLQTVRLSEQGRMVNAVALSYWLARHLTWHTH